MKNIRTELRNSIESFKSRLDGAEGRIRDLKDRTLGNYSQMSNIQAIVATGAHVVHPLQVSLDFSI